MTDPRMKKLADVLVNYSTKVKKGDWVQIQAGRAATPLVKELIASITKAGGNAAYELESNEIMESFYANASEDQLKWISPIGMMVFKEADVIIFINAPDNTKGMSGVDPKKQQIRRAAQRPLMETYMKRSASGDLRWTIANFPCPALAQEASMSLADYEDFVYKGTFADQDDPVKEWKKIHDEQERAVKWMAGKKEVVLRGTNVDLKMSIEGRTFINSDGDQNMPSGEIFTSPVEDSVNGWVKFTYPAIMMGREVEGVRLEFKNGKVAKAEADKNEDFLHKMIEMDEGASILGELGIGTNFGITKFTKDILFDEKIGGTFHLALGAGFEECGGSNKSGLHWDLICDARQDTEIIVDGEVFYKNGKFTI